MRIGEVARSCEVNPKTVRYYEEIGVLPKPSRTASGHRIYAKEDLLRLQFIRRLKSAGLSLAGIRQVLPAVDGRQCDHARSRLREAIAAQLREVEQRLRELRALRDALRRQLEAMEVAGVAPGTTATECECLGPATADGSILPGGALVRRPRGRKS
jgi:DNA-binding transcriptional MerR regulator